MKTLTRIALFTYAVLAFSSIAYADGVGVVKTLKGEVMVSRGDALIPAKLGDTLFAKDEVQTAADSSMGILLHDDSRLSLGPNTKMSLQQFSYDTASQDGSADIGIQQGTLSVIAGKMVEKTPGSLKVKTPAAILAVRGTEFSVKVDPR